MDHKGTQRLETRRLVLRRYTVDDAQAAYDGWCSDPEVARYTTWDAHLSPDVTRQLLEMWVGDYGSGQTYNWVLELKDTGRIIGNCAAVRVNEDIDEVELGWCMSRAEWGKGYMPEAVGEIMRFLFDEVGANRICAKHDVENAKSGRVMQKVGMKFEGVRRQGFRGRSGIKDVACYAMLKSDRETDIKELWDAYDREGRLLGVDLVRGEPIPKGMYHLVCEVIVRHADGDYLLMLRDPEKPIHPGEWELGAGGSVLKGEDAATAARRELFEETGIRCRTLKPLAVFVRDTGVIFHMFCGTTDMDKSKVVLQPGETVDWRWAPYDAVKAMLASGELPRGAKTGFLDAVEAEKGANR